MIGRVTLVVTVLSVAASAVRGGLRETPHNLSPGGAGARRMGAAGGASSSDDDLCVFCHTPHNAAGQQGLWNREMDPVTYKLYDSSTTEAEMQQPTGSSRLCLSCHDGVLALGSMKRHGRSGLPKMTGSKALGTDLSDDHPISFVYDQALAARRGDLVAPSALKGPVQLDDSGQMQCTSCHDAHGDRYPKFLVVDPRRSSLCVSCHRLPHWNESAHAESNAPLTKSVAVADLGLSTVGDAGCLGCHTSHAAAHPSRLLTASSEEGVCLRCHDGRGAATDLRRESTKYSAHRVEAYTEVHDPRENPATMPEHVECVDCHNSHAAREHSGDGRVPGPLAGVSGVSISGTYVSEASFEYEVCLKCHGLTEDADPTVYRVDNVTNVRLEINPRNESFHPVADVGRAPSIRGLRTPLTAASRTPCTSCHADDAAARRGGEGPRGPHGSIYRPILAAPYRYDATKVPESYQAYELCYTCHDRRQLLESDDGFPHRLHVVDAEASCAVCHDAHGSRRSAHLINFMSRDVTGEPVVTASSAGVLTYDSTRPGAGSCSLTCHQHDHDRTAYPARASSGRGLRSR